MGESVASRFASEFLCHLQEQYYAAVGLALPVVDTELIRLTAKMQADQFQVDAADAGGDVPVPSEAEVNEHIASLVAQTPSRYENPFLYGIVKGLADEINRAAEWSDLPLPSKPIFGTLPLHSINARTVLVPGSAEHLVLFDIGFFQFVLLFSKAIAQAFHVYRVESGGWEVELSHDAIWANIDGNPNIGMRFIQSLGSYLQGIRPYKPPQYYAPAAYSRLSDFLINGLQLFVLGHEYGHVAAGHLTSGTPTSAMLSNDLDSPRALLYSWEQEYEADEIGIVLSLVAMGKMHEDGEGGVFRFCGSELFFGAMDIIDRANSVIASGQVGTERPLSATHPPVVDRQLNIRRMRQRTMPEEMAASIAKTGEAVTFAIEALWQRAVPTFQKVHAQRAPRPADAVEDT